MQNMGKGNFTFDSFKVSYDSDPRLQQLVTNFDNSTIELKTSETDDLPATKPNAKNTVSNMAKKAVDLGSL